MHLAKQTVAPSDHLPLHHCIVADPTALYRVSHRISGVEIDEKGPHPKDPSQIFLLFFFFVSSLQIILTAF